MKEFLTVIFLTTLFAFSVNTFASVEENVGLTEVAPEQPATGGITPYSTEYPTNVWDLSSNGRYDFSGAANNNILYTNYKLSFNR